MNLMYMNYKEEEEDVGEKNKNKNKLTKTEKVKKIERCADNDDKH